MNSEFAKLYWTMFCVMLTSVACFLLTACGGDVEFVVPIDDETLLSEEVVSTNELLTQNVNEEAVASSANNAVNFEVVQNQHETRQLVAISPFDYVPANFKESFLKDNKISLKELMQIGEYFRCLRDTTVEPTRFILVDGTPIPLENGMDLSGKDLSGVRINNVTLSRVNFESSNLSGANLEQACFYNCNFHSADFTGANAKQAFFPGCDFSEASLRDSHSFLISYEQFLSTKDYKTREITFDARRFQRTDYFDFDYVDFFFANDAMVNAAGRCKFNNAYFRGNCSVLNMTKEQLTSTQNHKIKEFPGSLSLIAVERDVSTSLSGLDLSNCRIDCLSFEGYDLSGVDFTDARITNCLRFINCVGLTPEQLQSTWNWKNGKFSFDLGNSRVDWSNVDFSGLTFEQASCLGKGSVASANFSDATISYSTWANSPDVTVEQIKSTWNYKNREMCFLLGNPALDWSGTDFSNFKFAGNNLDGANVTNVNFTDAKFFGLYWTGTEIVLEKERKTNLTDNGGNFIWSLRSYSLKRCQGLTYEQIKSTSNFKGGHINYPTWSLDLPDDINYRINEF